ncbi:hypothetical protein KCU70_g336, partial [Aureobasidium melanogenum]
MPTDVTWVTLNLPSSHFFLVPRPSLLLIKGSTSRNEGYWSIALISPHSLKPIHFQGLTRSQRHTNRPDLLLV